MKLVQLTYVPIKDLRDGATRSPEQVRQQEPFALDPLADLDGIAP